MNILETIKQETKTKLSDEVFRMEMDKILKAQGLKKKSRNYLINTWLSQDIDRNKLLKKELSSIPKKEPINSEAWEQKQFVAWFKKTYPGIDIMMIRNDGTRTGFEKSQQVSMGLLAGASDLLIPDFNVWIEMKRSDGGAGQSKKQKEFQKRRESAGHTYLLCNGCEDAKQQIINFRGGKNEHL